MKILRCSLEADRNAGERPPTQLGALSTFWHPIEQIPECSVLSELLFRSNPSSARCRIFYLRYSFYLHFSSEPEPETATQFDLPCAHASREETGGVEAPSPGLTAEGPGALHRQDLGTRLLIAVISSHANGLHFYDAESCKGQRQRTWLPLH